MPIIELKNENEFIELVRGHLIIAAFSPAGDVPLSDLTDIKRVALVFGDEIHGISRAIETAADFRVRIEQTSEIDSLNVAIAAGIAMYKFGNVKLSGKNQ
jgi:tRNA G18 (ribose-2'-O)-methylase SpoU